VEDVTNWFTSATVGVVRCVGKDHAAAAVCGVEDKPQSELRAGPTELCSGDRLEFGGNIALRLDNELSVLDVKTDRCVRFMWVGVFAN
jgi:hypothetical protein